MNQLSRTTAPEVVSIVTAVYNHEQTVAETLESALMQKTDHPFHIYCLNDASTDRSGEILSLYEKRYPEKITVFTSLTNQGSGRKSFLHHRPPVKGRYWCLLAGDDYWTTEDKLDRQVDLLDSNGDVVGCGSYTTLRNEMTGEDSIIKPNKERWNLADLMYGIHPLYVHPSSILWRNVHLQDGFLPAKFCREDTSGDTLLAHYMLDQGGQFAILPEITSCYRFTGRGVWSRLSKEEQDTRNKQISRYLKANLPLKYRLIKIAKRNKKLRWLLPFLPAPVNR